MFISRKEDRHDRACEHVGERVERRERGVPRDVFLHRRRVPGKPAKAHQRAGLHQGEAHHDHFHQVNL